MRKSRLGLISGVGIHPYCLVPIAVCLFVAPAFASDSAKGGLAMHLLRPGMVAVADFDGDHIPDVASGLRTGHTSEGYSYQVDLDFSGSPQARPFSVFSEDSTGLNIQAVDIDGDHDLDLIITERLSARAISVWLNDGTGGFTRGDPGNYPLSGWQTRSSVQSPDPCYTVTLQFEWRRPQVGINRQPVDFRPASFFFRQVHFPSVDHSHIFIRSARFRAPPVSI